MNKVLDIELLEFEDIDVDLLESSGSDLDAEFEVGTIIYIEGGAPYEGPYVVRPKAYEPQILETKNKSMRDDVTVLKVPYQAVTNIQGGLTVNIAFDE